MTRDGAKAHDSAAERPDGGLFVGTLAKAFTVVEAFQDSGTALSLTEIANRTGLGRSAVQRFLYTLKTLGYIRQHPSTRRYSLSPKILGFADSYLRQDPLVEKAFPYLLDASKRTDETINLTELLGTEVIYVARFPSRNVLSSHLFLGARLPAFCISPGRAMLSHLPGEEARAILDRSELHAYTAHTITNRARILEKLAEARERGVAIAAEEMFVGDVGAGAPVLDRSGYPVAAVNVGAATPRWTVEEVERTLAPIVIETARAISRSLARA